MISGHALRHGRRRDCDVILISCYLHIYVVTDGGAVVWGQVGCSFRLLSRNQREESISLYADVGPI